MWGEVKKVEVIVVEVIWLDFFGEAIQLGYWLLSQSQVTSVEVTSLATSVALLVT